MNWYLKVFNNYSDFNGRASIEEFWKFNFFNIIFIILAIILDNFLNITIGDYAFGPIYILYNLILFIPNLAVNIRRLHDVGKSGWMILISLIPIIGVIWLFFLFITDGDLGENKYGENPKRIINENLKISVTNNEDDNIEKFLSLIPEKIKLLKETFESGLISQNELNEKLQKLENEKLSLESKFQESLEIVKSKEFNLKIEEKIKTDKEKLLKLKNGGLLTELEYNNKIEILFNKQVEINYKEQLEKEKQLEIEEKSKLSESTKLLIFIGVISIILLFTVYRYFTSEF